MVDFDRTRTSFIENIVRDFVDEPRTGKVQRVYEHLEGDDDVNFAADVSVDGGTRLERLAPLTTEGNDKIDVPQVGDTVMVEFLAGESSRPVITGFASTTTDRPPLGKAGMERNRLESGDSPMGSGDVFTTEYSRLSGNPARQDTADLDPEDVFVQIAKRSGDVPDPSKESDIPAKFEFFDSPNKDEAYVEAAFNVVDGESVDATWGLKLNVKDGSFKLVDGSGYGIVSDGSGNLTLEFESKTENQVSGGGSLSL